MTTELDYYFPPSAGELELTWKLAERLSGTEFVSRPMRGKPEAVLACMLTGREMGIGHMQALRDIFIIEGTPTMRATLMATRARSAGHRVRTVEQTDQRCTVQIHRAGEQEPEEPVTWTVEMARTAGLLGKDNWKRYPQAMLWNRAVAAAVRRDCSEVLGGVIYTPEELGGAPTTVVTAGGAVVDTETGELVAEPAAAEAGPAEGNGGAPAYRSGGDVDAWRKRATSLPNDAKERLVAWTNAEVDGGWRWLWRSGTTEDWSGAFAAAGITEGADL